MVHSRRPLQEKMTLFWHNHFATAYTKIAGALGAEEGARYMAAKPSEDPNQVKGQIELFREYAVGNFRDLLLAVAKDTAMLVWLDGRTNVKGKPQENFARELMELFTMGVDTFAETDVYAGARVFTGWNLARPSNAYYTFSYVAGQHDTTAKEFTFPIYSNGSKVIPARSARRGHAGRRRFDQRRGSASRDRPAARAQAVSVLRQRGLRTRSRADHGARRTPTIAAGSR